MIPKIIHYCWFGKNKKPAELVKYIEGWRKICPDIEIKEWNEDNFDISHSKYAREAYKAEKWAFVSDYARYRILYEYGGICMDTDVELIKPLDGILQECESYGAKGFMGIERPENGEVNPGLICGAEPRNAIIKELLMGYKGRSFCDDKKKKLTPTVVDFTTECLKKRGLSGENELQMVDGIRIYPAEFFNPMDMSTGRVNITSNTVSIHHFEASWVDPYSKFRGRVYRRIKRTFGEKTAEKFRYIFGRKKQ